MSAFRSFLFSGILAFAATAPVSAVAAETRAPNSGVVEQEVAQERIDGLLRSAYAGSPKLKAAHSRWMAALQRIPQARSLPDPTLSYGYFVEKMDTRQTFSVEQMFPGFGKRDLRAGVAEEAAKTAAIALEVAAADLRLEVLEAVANLSFVLQSERLVEENLALVQQLEQVALQRYRAAESSQADVLRLQMEAEALKADAQSWKQRRPAAHARLNALLGRPPNHPLPEIADLPVAIAPDAAEGVSPDSLMRNPEIRESQNEIFEAQRSHELAQKESRPDFGIGAEYMDNSSMAPDEVMAMLSISFPVWRGRYRAMREEAAATLLAAEHDYADQLNRLRAKAEIAAYEREDAARQVRLFEQSLLPRARQTLEILESDYQTGESGFLDLLEAQRALLDLELGLARAKTDYFVRAAQWERVAGPFPEAATEVLSNTPSHE